MSFDKSTISLKLQSAQVLYKSQNDVDSDEVSTSDRSSLAEEPQEENMKRKLHAVGLYEPGSGEICAKYIAMSASSVIHHPFYNYPAVLDPGIKEALLAPEGKPVYPNDGQMHYLALRKQMNQCPVKVFHEGLLKEAIDLKYYGVNPYGVRAMAKALEHNRNVLVLDLTDNFLNDDACFHLSAMLVINTTLVELNLSGCRIGASGAKQLLFGLPMNRCLRYLNLSKNQISDEGVKYIAESIVRGLDVQRLNLSCNNLTGEAANLLTEALDISNKITSLDLSWNKFSILPQGLFHLLFQLSESNCLEELNLSWNALGGVRIGNAIKSVLTASKLKTLDISNNRLSAETIDIIAQGLHQAKSLINLDLSFNPMSSNDSLTVILVLQSSSVKIRRLAMENVSVNKKFLHRLQLIKEVKQDLVVTYGDVIGSYNVEEPDLRDIVLSRVDYLAKKRKKRSVDIALLALQLLKDNMRIMSSKAFSTAIEESGLVLDDELVQGMVEVFGASKTKKDKAIDISLMVDFVKRKWPDRKLPPTPPPVPEIEPQTIQREEIPKNLPKPGKR